MNRTSRAGTVISAAAWSTVCGYLHFAWPSLAALLETLGARPWVQVPTATFPALAAVIVLGLHLKDRWLRAPLAIAVDAVVAAPPLAGISFLVYPFLVPLE